MDQVADAGLRTGHCKLHRNRAFQSLWYLSPLGQVQGQVGDPIELKAVEVIVLGVVGVDIALVLAAKFSMTFSFALVVVALHVVDELLKEVVHLAIALFAAFALVEHVVRVDLVGEVDLSAFPFSLCHLWRCGQGIHGPCDLCCHR